MKAKKLIATGLVASMLMLALTGCGAGGNSGESAKDTDKGSVYFLNFKSELSSEWNEMKRKENSFLAFIKFTAPIDIMVPFKVEDRIILPVNKHQ